MLTPIAIVTNSDIYFTLKRYIATKKTLIPSMLLTLRYAFDYCIANSCMNESLFNTITVRYSHIKTSDSLCAQ